MIRAQLSIDFFALWSVPLGTGARLAPAGLVPVQQEDRAWLVFSAVEFRRTRMWGLPLPRMAHASLMLYAQDSAGGQGNFFLRAETSFRPLSLAARRKAVFGSSRGGFMELGGRMFRCPLEKSHWEMQPVQVNDWACKEVEAWGGRFEFAFLTSESQATWARPHLLMP